ncbi:Atlastin-2 [Halotydeus destructor]|nr:Atlastin-2 [Halotydeus destructor]
MANFLSLILGLTLVVLQLSSVVHGNAVRIIQINEGTKEFELDTKALEAILMGPECRNRPVSIVSIAGATRKGKSFMLNFFLRYLMSGGSNDWLGSPDSPLQGFSWRGGSDRDTTGILLWSQPFVLKMADGREVAVLLMDTQGAFDGLHTIADTAAIFAISTLTSSVQVFNIFTNIQEDDLQNLELFTEYGRLALEQSGAKPFQKLLFLVRDWQYPDEYDYGIEGGRRFLDKKLEVTQARTGELERVRKFIRAVFTELECFPMPHPGMKVARTKNFDGRIRDIDSEFLKELNVLVKHLLGSNNIITKKVGGQEVNGMQLVEYFKAYVKIFTSGAIMKPTSIMEATAHANNQAALAVARDLYTNRMAAAFSSSNPSVPEAEFVRIQTMYQNEAINVFNSHRKLGGASFSQAYLEQLTAQMVDAAKQYQTVNHFKREMEENAHRAKELENRITNLNGQYDELERVRNTEIQQNTALGQALKYYDEKNLETFGATGDVVDAVYLHQKHVQLLNEAINVFTQSGGPSSGILFERLKNELERTYQHNKAQNDVKIAIKDQQSKEGDMNGRINDLIAQQGQLQDQLRAAQEQARRASKQGGGGFWGKVKKFFG